MFFLAPVSNNSMCFFVDSLANWHFPIVSTLRRFPFASEDFYLNRQM